MKKSQNKKIAIFAFSMMCLIGTYNAVMINSESGLSNNQNVKHLDDAFGSVKTGRTLAVVSNWKKLETSAPQKIAVAKAASESLATPASESAIQDDLNLKLVEVNNPKKWAQGVKADQFTGSIEARNGVIESLNANLPEGLNIEIAFSEMTGNTFEYDLNGEIYSGIMYQVDQNAYMVTMTNGPLEGTRMRFAGENKDQEQTEAYLAETHNVEVQEFGSQVESAPESIDAEVNGAQTAEVSSFNFNI